MIRYGPQISEQKPNTILQYASQPFVVGPPDVPQVNNPSLPVEPAPPEQHQPKGRLLQKKQVTAVSYYYFIFTLIFSKEFLYVYICLYNRLVKNS